MSKERFKEILCIILLVIFIFTLSSQKNTSSKTVSEIYKALSESTDFSMLKKCDSLKFKEETALSAEDYTEVLYYASSSVMEVREVIIIKLQNKNQLENTKNALLKRAEEKGKLFEGYAPEQAALLKNYVLEEKAGILVFAVCNNREKLISAFKSAV